MAAKRFGAVPTNVEGLGNQILRVKSDESGFEFFTPASLPEYTITNDTEDRSFDANSTNIDEVADVLATLIKDIDSVIGGNLAFQWSTSEQVYPFEKASDGSTLYCKEVDFGYLPNNGTKSVSHGISISDTRKFHFWYGITSANDGAGNCNMITGTLHNPNYGIVNAVDSTTVGAVTVWDASTYYTKFRFIYRK